jgi:hypothetical protein
VVYSPVLSLDERSSYSGEGISPNPARSRLILSLGSRTPVEQPFRIVNAAGQTVKQGKLSLRTGFNQVPLDVADLPKGIYQLFCEGTQPRGFRFVKH